MNIHEPTWIRKHLLHYIWELIDNSQRKIMLHNYLTQYGLRICHRSLFFLNHKRFQAQGLLLQCNIIQLGFESGWCLQSFLPPRSQEKLMLHSVMNKIVWDKGFPEKNKIVNSLEEMFEGLVSSWQEVVYTIGIFSTSC